MNENIIIIVGILVLCIVCYMIYQAVPSKDIKEGATEPGPTDKAVEERWDKSIAEVSNAETVDELVKNKQAEQQAQYEEEQMPTRDRMAFTVFDTEVTTTPMRFTRPEGVVLDGSDKGEGSLVDATLVRPSNPTLSDAFVTLDSITSKPSSTYEKAREEELNEMDANIPADSTLGQINSFVKNANRTRIATVVNKLKL